MYCYSSFRCVSFWKHVSWGISNLILTRMTILTNARYFHSLMCLPQGPALDDVSALITDSSVFSVFLSENMAAKGFFPHTCCQKHWASCATAPRTERVSRWSQRACLRECFSLKCLLRHSTHLCYLHLSCLGFVYLTKQMCSLHGHEAGTSCLGLFLWQRTEGKT